MYKTCSHSNCFYYCERAKLYQNGKLFVPFSSFYGAQECWLTRSSASRLGKLTPELIYTDRVQRMAATCSLSNLADSQHLRCLTGRHFVPAYSDPLVCRLRNEPSFSLCQLILEAWFINAMIYMRPAKLATEIPPHAKQAVFSNMA